MVRTAFRPVTEGFISLVHVCVRVMNLKAEPSHMYINVLFVQFLTTGQHRLSSDSAVDMHEDKIQEQSTCKDFNDMGMLSLYLESVSQYVVQGSKKWPDNK